MRLVGQERVEKQKPSKTCRVDPRACGGYKPYRAWPGKHNGRSPLASAGEVPAVGFMQAVGHHSAVGLAGQAGVSIVTASKIDIFNG